MEHAAPQMTLIWTPFYEIVKAWNGKDSLGFAIRFDASPWEGCAVADSMELECCSMLFGQLQRRLGRRLCWIQHQELARRCLWK
jgi:hypothetical protein